MLKEIENEPEKKKAPKRVASSKSTTPLKSCLKKKADEDVVQTDDES